MKGNKLQYTVKEPLRKVSPCHIYGVYEVKRVLLLKRGIYYYGNFII